VRTRDDELVPPGDLRATRFTEDGQPYVVLSFSSEALETRLAEHLTPAQTAVALAAIEGHTTEAIARRRGRSVGTVAKQLEGVYRRLGISSRRELVAWAWRPDPHTSG
jgi:DNA-binding CsgD family transcriptional regulator